MRFFITLIFLVVLALVTPTGAAQPPKPHIVLFIADDLTFNDITPYGSPDAHTPNLEKLAAQSLKFTQAFAASPTCTPSRSSIYTGLFPMRNGAHANHAPVNDNVTTLPTYLKKLGYRVVIAGKTHIGPRAIFPFEYLPNSNIMPPGKHELLWTDLNTAAVDDLLAHNDPQTQPLCLIVAAHSSHVYWLSNDGTFDPKSVHLPPGFVDTPQTRNYRCDYLTDVAHMDQQVGDVLASLDKHHYADNTLLLFTADQGAQWPFAKWSLYDAGIHVPLLVRWPGHTKAGTTTTSMASLVDLLPTFIAAAGSPPPADLDGRSLLPLLSDPSRPHRTEIYAAHTGDREMNHAPMRCVRTPHFEYIHNLRPDIRYTTHISDGIDLDGRAYFDQWVARAKTDPTAKTIVDRYYIKPPEELYDLDSDPYQLTNLVANPAFAKTLDELRDKLKQWRLQQGEDLSKAPLPEDARVGAFKYAG